MVLPTSPPASMSVSQILAEFGITAGTTKRISNDLFPLVGGTAGLTCLLGASFSGKSAVKVGYSTIMGTQIDIGYSITVDSTGNIYVIGTYFSSIPVPINTFGATPTASGVSLPVSLSQDIFVIKWNAGGTVAGYTTIRGSNVDRGNSIAVDSSQNIYVTGLYTSTTTVPINTFGTAPTASGFNLPVSTGQGQDIFVIKWNGSNGTVAGYATIRGNGTDTGNAITVDSSQNIYVTGQYTSTSAVPINEFGAPPTVSGVNLPSTTGTDAFVIKWNGSNGTLVGYSTIRGTGTDTGNGIAVDSVGNIYITGAYISTTTVPINTFGTAPTATGSSLPIASVNAMFALKYNSSGALVSYVYLNGGATTNNAQSIAVDSAGNIYIAGQYNSASITVPINTFTISPGASGFSLPLTSGQDIFVIKWSGSTGAVLRLTILKGSGSDLPGGIVVDSSQNVYLTGRYVSTTTVPINTFGTNPTASGVSLPVTVSTDAFVIKWNGSNGTVAGYTNINGTGIDAGNGIAVDSSQNIYVTGQYISTGAVPINKFGTAPTASGVNLPATVATDAFVIKWFP